MILTSHYMEDVLSLCERLLILREGELVFSGSLSEITDQMRRIDKFDLIVKVKT